MPAGAESYIHPEEKQARLLVVDRQQFWHWVCALVVTLLAITTFVLLSFPGFTQPIDPLYRVEPVFAFPGLVSLLLVFNAVSIHRQWVLRKERAAILSIGAAGDSSAEAAGEAAAPAGTDELTGLANRAEMEQWLGKEMAAARTRRKPLTLLVLELGEFNRVYRSGGNELCAAVLQQAGERLRAAIRGSDLAARLNDGEFAVALPGCALSEAAHVTGRVGEVSVKRGTQALSLEFSTASADMQASESPAEFLARAQKLLKLYADADAGCASLRVSA